MNTERVLAAYLSGQSAKSLAREESVSTWLILNRLRKAGVQIRTSAKQNEKSIGSLSDRLLSLIAQEVLTKLGYLTISNALQWRLQYGHAIRQAGKVAAVRSL